MPRDTDPAVPPITMDVYEAGMSDRSTTIALTVTPFASEPSDPEKNFTLATPVSSVSTYTGEMLSPPPVVFSMEKATGAPPTT